jgi:RNAse (barnase) inhibitor barstar
MRDPFEYIAAAVASSEPDPAAATLYLSADIDGREALFDAYARALDFPDWFGRNWDALWDLLTDLSWLDSPPVAIIHTSLPQLPPDQLAIYVALLAEAVVTSAGTPSPIVVRFAERDRPQVAALLAERATS